MPELLTLKLLERLDRTLRDVGAAIVECWEPGLTREQMDVLTEPHGFRLPDEAALWWGWHNGAGRAEITPTPCRFPVTLESAMRDFEVEQGAMSDAFGLTRLVGVVNEQPWLWFDCRGASDTFVPVYAGYKSNDPWVAAESIGDMVLALIAAFETRRFTTNERGEWNEVDWDEVPEAMTDSGIL